MTDVSWHLIGPLQSNKTAQAAAFDWVESVDRLKIAQRLSAQRDAGLPPLSVCIEVNVSGESSKSGVAPGEAVALAKSVAALPNLRVRGIMGNPGALPPTPRRRARSSARWRAAFSACRDAGLAVDTLSMGMSADLELAIEEGATQVRVGTAIFGVRQGQDRP
jgi:pyridoxal phosphate enzyme (YggS family)